MTYYIMDSQGHRWKVREAVSIKAACHAISMARVTGSVGFKTLYHDTDGSCRVLSDVVRIHGDDFSEQKPYEPLRGD